MNKLRRTKGTTLLEIIISIAILGIILVSFVSMFSSSLTNIYVNGNKSKAVEKAQGLIEKAWNAGDINVLNSISCYSDISNINIYEVGKETKYSRQIIIINGVSYDKLTVAVFYQRGKKSVVLSSLIPIGGIKDHERIR